MARQYPLRKVPPAQARHHDVGQDQVDRATVRLGKAERLFAIGRLDDGVAKLGQDTSAQASKRRLVLDQQDRLRAGRGGDRLAIRAAWAGVVSRGERDRERGATLQLA